MRVLLDSNAYSRLMRGDDQTAAAVRDATEVLMSAVVIGEPLYGFRNGSRFDRNATDLRSFLDNPYVSFVPVGPVTADRYSRIAAGLGAKGNPIPTNDVWIAAHAMETGRIWYQPTGTLRPWTASPGCGWAARAENDGAKLLDQ